MPAVAASGIKSGRVEKVMIKINSILFQRLTVSVVQ
jgi:hypothetical protein